MKRASLILFLLLLLASVGFVLHTSAELPERVASHFNAAHQADGWQDRGAFLRMTLLTNTLLPLVLAGAFWLISLAPMSTLSIPKKEIWSHPALREPLRRILRDAGFWLGSVSICFFTAIYALVLRANQPPPSPLDGSLMTLITLVNIVFTMIVLLVLFLRLLKPPVAALNTRQVED